MDCERITTAYSRCCNFNGKISPGTSAVFTVIALYLTIAFSFTAVFIFGNQKNSTQIYNVSIRSESYNSSLRIQVEHLMMPLEININCQTSDGNIQVVYDVQDRIILYKNKEKHWCYIRASSGPQFQKDVQIFKDVLLGKISTLIEATKTIHLSLLPAQVPNHELENEIGSDLFSLCKDERSFWLTRYYKDALIRSRRHFNQTQHVDVCFQNLIIHRFRP